MKLVNKPQFDTKEIKVGSAVRLYWKYKLNLKHNSQVSKFSDGDYALIIAVRPLEMIVLLKDNKQASIDVEDVAREMVTIKELVEREDV